LSITNLPERDVVGHPVRMMLPPAEATWRLNGTEREFIFEYGYDPVAWRDGQGNGTEFSVWLEAPGVAPQLLFKRLLDPAHVPSDRAAQTAQIDLPLLPIGAQIKIETGPGEYNDNAWDWAYIARVRYRHGTFYTEKQVHGSEPAMVSRHAVNTVTPSQASPGSEEQLR
ncbi:MAG TPA: hypothetical protein VFJ90_16820, partial [Candidatus Didemnitutus sp.]|nr:hypothetical protein [Candidatus Didemnitutus sp.]